MGAPSLASPATPEGRASCPRHGPHPACGRRRGGGCARLGRHRESGSGCSRAARLALRSERRQRGGSAASPAPSPPPAPCSPRTEAGTRSCWTHSGPRDGGRTRGRSAGLGPTGPGVARPGPRPVPSPAGSPGQHHGRRPGSPSAPGRGLLDPQAPSRLAQGLLRLCVQAARPAGAGRPRPRALSLAPHGTHAVPRGAQERQDGQCEDQRRPPGLQAPCGEEDDGQPRHGRGGVPRHQRGERLLPVVHFQLRLPQLLLPGLHCFGLLPQGPGQEASQRPERGSGRRQDSPAVQHHQLCAGRLLHHSGLHLPAVPAHRLLRPRGQRRRRHRVERAPGRVRCRD